MKDYKICNKNIPKSTLLRNTNQYMYRSSQHINNIASKHVLCTLQVLMELDRQTGSLHHKNNKFNFQFHIILNTLQHKSLFGKYLSLSIYIQLFIETYTYKQSLETHQYTKIHFLKTQSTHHLLFLHNGDI